MHLSNDDSAARIAAWLLRRTTSGAVRRVAPVGAAIGTDTGSVRDGNEDRAAIARSVDFNGDPYILAVLADGIGGLRSGAECAALALGAFISAVSQVAQKKSRQPEDWLRQAAVRANAAVYEAYSGGGGCTLVALLFAKGYRPCWLSVGDSRVYQYAGGILKQLSKDDTLDGQLGKVAGGERRSELLQFVGIGADMEPHTACIDWDVFGQDGALFLTSDGVHFIEESYLEKVIYFSADIGLSVRRLIDLAKMLGGPDNASAVALGLDALASELEEGAAPPNDAIEIWDAFNEIQLIWPTVGRNRIGEVREPVRIEPGGRLGFESPPQVAQQNAADREGDKSVSHDRSSESKKTRASRARKRKVVESDLTRNEDEPQLGIEFRKK